MMLLSIKKFKWLNCWAEKRKNDRFRCCFILFNKLGFTINILHSGSGFKLYLCPLIIYSQAWFGELNEVHWADGKFVLCFPFMKYKKYSQKKGWYK
jgi:hypothetical protein